MTTYMCNMFKMGGDEVLTDDEKLTLGMVLREKIVETHDVDDVIQKQLIYEKSDSTKLILNQALKNIRSIRDDCYSIALKLSIK